MPCQALRIASLALAISFVSLASHLHGSAPSQARVVTRAAPPSPVEGVRYVAIDDQLRQHVQVIERTVVAPEAVVSRSLAEQPVYTHLIEVQVVNTTIYIDPARDYMRKGQPGGLDEGHFIIRAQRLYHARRSVPARVVRNELVEPIEAVQSREPRALFIIPKPEFHERPSPGNRVEHETSPDVQPTQQRPQRVMPTVPVSPHRTSPPPDRIVRADY